MEGILKQSTAINVTVTMISSTDNTSGKTGLTLTIYSSKAGATPAAITPTVTEIDSTNTPGVYKLALTTGHVDTLGELLLHVTGTGALPTDLKWQISARLSDDLAYPATSGRSMVVDASGLVDANTVKIGPTGSGTAQAARDIGTSVLLSAGSGTGQLDFTSGVVKANPTQWLGGTIPAVNVTGVPLVDLKYTLGTISPATAGSIRADAVTGAVGSVTGAVGSVTSRVTANADQLAGQTITAAAGVTFPTSVASPTNITAGTITIATNLTNAPTVGDFTSTMKASLNSATPTVTVSDKTGFSLSTAGILAIWHQLTSAIVTAATIGKLLIDNITGDSYARLGAPAGASHAADIAAVNSKTTNLPAVPASTTNITAGTITTVNNLTNAPTSGDLTSTMKSSVTTAATAATPIAASVTGAVGSISSGGISSSSFAAGAINAAAIATDAITAAKIAADAIGASELAADAVAEIQSGLATGSPLDAAGVRAAIGLASANLDTQLDALPTNIELATALSTADDATLAAIASVASSLVKLLAAVYDSFTTNGTNVITLSNGKTQTFDLNTGARTTS